MPTSGPVGVRDDPGRRTGAPAGSRRPGPGRGRRRGGVRLRVRLPQALPRAVGRGRGRVGGQAHDLGEVARSAPVDRGLPEHWLPLVGERVEGPGAEHAIGAGERGRVRGDDWLGDVVERRARRPVRGAAAGAASCATGAAPGPCLPGGRRCRCRCRCRCRGRAGVRVGAGRALTAGARTSRWARRRSEPTAAGMGGGAQGRRPTTGVPRPGCPDGRVALPVLRWPDDPGWLSRAPSRGWRRRGPRAPRGGAWRCPPP